MGGRDESVGLRNADACDIPGIRMRNGGGKSAWDSFITELQWTIMAASRRRCGDNRNRVYRAGVSFRDEWNMRRNDDNDIDIMPKDKI